MSRVAVVRNLAKIWLLFLTLTTAFGAAGWSLGGPSVSVAFAGCAVLLAGTVYWYADRIVAGMLDARELAFAESPALHSALEGLAARARVPKPKAYLLRDGHPRALAVGRGATGAGIVVSAGLLAAAPPAELEGVLAHEIAHVRHRDVLLQTSAVLIATMLVEMSRIGGWLERALLFVFGPVAAAVVHLLLSPRREFLADRLAAELCESPHGLADALLRLEQANELVDFAGSPATEPLYTVNPFAEEGIAALFDTHPPIGERIRRLRDLDPDWREKLRAA